MHTSILLLYVFLLAPRLWAFPVSPPQELTPPADDPGLLLSGLIEARKWNDLPLHFYDLTYGALNRHFTPAVTLKFTYFPGENRLGYQVRFTEQAEQGTILFNRRPDGRFGDIRITNRISPLYFVAGYQAVPVRNFSLPLGEGQLLVPQGTLYIPQPFRQGIYITGRITFTITPSDTEEQLTLERLNKSRTLSLQTDWAILQLPPGSLPLSEETIAKGSPIPVDSPLLAEMNQLFNSFFGIFIKRFNEHWYLPPNPDDTFLFLSRGRNTPLLYAYNPQQTPDTRLQELNNGKVWLSYLSDPTPRLMVGADDPMRNIRASLFYNPDTRYMSGTVSLDYENADHFRAVQLGQGLFIRGNLQKEGASSSVLRRQETYYFVGEPTDRLSFYFNGTVQPEFQTIDRFKTVLTPSGKRESDFHFHYLTRDQNYFPNPGLTFSPITLTITLPGDMNCLASGDLVEHKVLNRNRFTFSNPSCKGFSLVCGRFERLRTLKTDHPLVLWGEPNTRPQNYYDMKVLRNGYNLLLQRYSPLELRQTNLLFQLTPQEGGMSYPGLVLISYNPRYNVYGPAEEENRLSQVRNSPVFLTRDPTLTIIHELAHQWWGGVISWASYRDVWFTEGFAQLSVLDYLSRTTRPKAFLRTLRSLNREVMARSDWGPVIYGNRLASLSDFNTFQHLVYNKSALILWQLKELMGEKSFFEHVRRTLHDLRHTSTNTSRFIHVFANQDPLVKQYLTGWVHHRSIPELRFELQPHGRSTQLRILQNQTDLVFPLSIDILTEDGWRNHKVIVREKDQTVSLHVPGLVSDVRLADDALLVRLASGRG